MPPIRDATATWRRTAGHDNVATYRGPTTYRGEQARATFRGAGCPGDVTRDDPSRAAGRAARNGCRGTVAAERPPHENP